MLRAVFGLCLLLLTVQTDPPIYNFPYYTSFEADLHSSTTNSTSHGQQWYEPGKNRWRVDRNNGRDNDFCGTVIPSISTPCIHYYVQDKLWLVFPQRYQCCFCCEASKGCGIVKPDFFKDAKYQGTQDLDHVTYDKWDKDVSGKKFVAWVSQDANKIPKKLNLNDLEVWKFNGDFFRKDAGFTDSIFSLPSYCSPLRNCPLESQCGKFRDPLNLQSE